ncbi:hypothetical protein [Serratia bockelmannii]|uniref:hypothetical protein n=1 Tax=Serratia bockelmannii TaxID=2703793 RepID=UPI003CF5B814
MFTPLILPNGSRLPNRLAKAALEENLADEGQLPGPALWRLYRHWGIGGAGLIITGNVMIDGRAMTGPGGVVPSVTTARWRVSSLGSRCSPECKQQQSPSGSLP